MSLPEQHTAIAIAGAGGPQMLQPRRLAVPQPHDDEVLIQVKAAGVNRHDCNQRRRGPTAAHSDIPGLEVSGVVVAVGRDVRDIQPGNPVCALTDGGGYAPFAIAKAAQCLPKPAGMDWLAAAALPEAAFTVWHNFFGLARLGPGESVLLHGGTSGVGSLAIQLLAELGHPVYATCGSDDKVEAAMKLGARRAFNYRSDDFAEGVLRETQGLGVDVILDMSGARHTARDVQALAHRGRLLHLSPGDGAEFRASLRTMMAKELRVSGSLLRPLPDGEKARIATHVRRVFWPLIESGRASPVVHAAMPLHAAAEAHAVMERAAHVGKIVLDCEQAASA